MLWSWDSLSSSSKIIGLTFFSSKTTRSQYYRHSLLALTGATPRRQLRASRIMALVLGL